MTQRRIWGISRLEALLAHVPMHEVMLVCGHSFSALPMPALFRDAVRFDAFTPNPLYEEVCQGVSLFCQRRCRMLVAVGGGSAMDVAKCIKLFCRMDPSVSFLQQEERDSGVPLIAVPTTAGSGSESTQYAVIYHRGEKQSVFHPSLLPDYAVLEPLLLQTLPLYQKKCTMLDALCQAIEACWSVHSTHESNRCARRAIATIAASYRAYLFEESGEAATRVMRAANDAGRAIQITQTTAPHAMSYQLTALYRLPHGHAVALCLPEVWEYTMRHPELCVDPRGVEHLKRALSELPVDPQWFRALVQELGMQPAGLTPSEAQLEFLTQSVHTIRLKNHPVALQPDVLRNMYERMLSCHEG